MPSIEIPVAWEAYFLRGFDYPLGAYQPFPIAGAPATLVGSAPYFVASEDGNYLEDQWNFATGDVFPGLVFDETWTPPGTPVDIAVDWRVYIGTEFGGVALWFMSPGFMTDADASAGATLATGWNTGTLYLSQAPTVLDPTAFIGSFLGSGQQSYIQMEVWGRDQNLPAQGHTYRVDLLRAYVITQGDVRIPLRQFHRDDGLGVTPPRAFGGASRIRAGRAYGYD